MVRSFVKDLSMRHFAFPLAVVSSLTMAVPVTAQSTVPALDVEVALNCGVGHSFFSGLLEEEDPGLAAELLQLGSAWMLLAFERLGEDENQFEAKIDQRLEVLLGLVEYAESDEVIEAIFTDVTEGCAKEQATHSAAFEAAIAEVNGAEIEGAE